ncbi:MAG: ABC transporter substrate-binding protein, partial [Nesterenkonia sp.]|nr:ABC transporter substrate-binding protein [Nesterenkonia sp.]
ACGTDDPMGGGEGGDADEDGGTLVVGSQQYYSNTIIAEAYAQVLEDQGYEVEREFEIGQREVYVPEMEDGSIDVFPEYTGNFLEYLDSESEASDSEEVASDLEDAMPEGLTALEPAEATDQDSYTVTAEFAEEHDLTEIGDLADVDEDLSVAANSEFQTRPYGPDGVEEVYGVELTLNAVEDSGGPLTVNALTDGEVQVADIYTADPAIEENDLVVLEDPEDLILPQQVVPIVSDAVDDDARAALDELSAALDQEALLEMNTQSVDDQSDASEVASDWLESEGLVD